MTERPLDGVLVAELTSLVPGPLAGAILAGYGAEVVKVEPPDGDLLRHMQPAMFRICNRGKRSVSLDLKDPAGRRRLEGLLERVDVLLTSFRQGTQKRLGIDAEAMAQHHPDLVHVSICGFSDPDDPRPGHDLNYLAEAGLVHLFGLGRDADTALLRVPLADVGGAQFAASAALARLFQRERTGRAEPVVVSLQDAALALTRTRAAEVLDRPRERSIDDTIAKPAYGTFLAADGRWVAIAALEDHLWGNLASLLDLPDAIRTLGYGERLARVREVNEAVAAAVARRPSDELLAPDAATSIAATPVAALDVAGPDIVVPGEQPASEAEVPALGADTERLLEGLEG